MSTSEKTVTEMTVVTEYRENGETSREDSNTHVIGTWTYKGIAKNHARMCKKHHPQCEITRVIIINNGFTCAMRPSEWE